MLNNLTTLWMSLPDYAQSTFWIVVITIALIILVALLTLWERKVIGWMQLRRGPNRVRIFGLLPGIGQPFADVFKLLLKEVVIPAKSNKLLFRLAPIITLVPAFAAWAVIPLSPTVVVSKADAGLLYLLSLTSMGVYGVIIAGWAANSKYAFLGAMRSAAQMVSYEIAMGFALVGVLMATGSMNLGTIVATQAGGILSWNWFWLFPLFMVYFISGIAETNRAPFDVAEGESEIVAGFHVEYSGMAFALFFLAEYANMILISALTAGENVLLAARYVRRDRTEATRAASLLMDRLGVAERAGHYPPTLSGGEQQRVAFCRAVLNDPAVILADEPTGNLDEDNARVILAELRARARAGAAVVLVTHSPELAREADRVLHLDGGRLVNG